MNKKYLIVGIIGFSLFILVMSLILPGGDVNVDDIDTSTLSPYERCIRSSGEKGWNVEKNSCLFFSGNINDVEASIESCNRGGGQMNGDVQYTDLQDKNNTSFIECQYPTEIINTQGK